MNKELEALENLNDIAYYEDGYGDLASQSYLTLKLAIKRNEPMKVELVKHYVGFGYYKCPKCEKTIIEADYNYCPDCGQKLDWSDDK